jgi:glycyl-tRNA synthetase beta chain
MATFLLEVGTEELPASFVDEALEQWRSRIPQSLAEHSLFTEAVEGYGTPRRLAVLIKNLPVQQPDQEEDIKGPPAQAAFKDGKPTKAAEGFARSRNVGLEELEIRTTEKGAFVFARRKIAGRPTVEILTELVPQWILGLEGKRFMRWGDGDLRFSRPICWLVALLDEAVLPIELVNGSETIRSDRISQGHRVLHPESIQLTHAASYVETLASAYVDVDLNRRRTQIQAQVQAVAKQVGGWAEFPAALLSEVTNLVEWPSAVAGKFDSDFLSLPAEVITTEMVSHQRYFPVRKSEGSEELLPYFITISNGDPAKSRLIAAGNERVIRARLADGKFFYEADRAIPLESYLPRLEKVTFQAQLGSVLEKVKRICENANRIAGQLQVATSTGQEIQRAALLCKADLVTQMVGEFPELQGVMGQKYALTSGESAAVATAIFEHYLPRNAGDRLPQSLTGQVVGLADRLDTLVSIFGLGQLPTGSSDPFGLRRAANAIVSVTWAAELAINLGTLLQQISAEFVQTYTKSQPLDLLQQQLNNFFIQRVRSLLQEDWKIDYDLVNAVLGEADPEYTERALSDLLDVRDRAQFLQAIRADGTLAKIYETVNRAARLASQGNLDTAQLDPTIVVQPQLFQQPSEHAFYAALMQLLPQTQAAQNQRDYSQLVDALSKMAPTVSRFFDGPESVLVMDANLDIRRNRLNLLGLLRNHARVLADFGAIVKS